jgi:hypothetical protein
MIPRGIALACMTNEDEITISKPAPGDLVDALADYLSDLVRPMTKSLCTGWRFDRPGSMSGLLQDSLQYAIAVQITCLAERTSPAIGRREGRIIRDGSAGSFTRPLRGVPLFLQPHNRNNTNPA